MNNTLNSSRGGEENCLTLLYTGKAKRGKTKAIPADYLLATALKRLVDELHQRKISPEHVGDLVVGSIAAPIQMIRVAGLKAGLPVKIPVKKVDRLCSSGLQAVADVAASIRQGDCEIAIAAGVESMSTYTRVPVTKDPEAVKDPIMSGAYLPMVVSLFLVFLYRLFSLSLSLLLHIHIHHNTYTTTHTYGIYLGRYQ